MKKSRDNRSYFYAKSSYTNRVEFYSIEKVVGSGKKVIDLGCGDGSLMQILVRRGNICEGIEISKSGVAAAKSKGLKVNEGRIDVKLPFEDKKFDYAICNVTLQMVMYPEVLLGEMKRVSKRQIVTFPNFAFILNRLELMLLGIFPKWSLFGYQWFSTGHIHQLSIKDFEIFCDENSIKVIRTLHLGPVGYLAKLSPNLFATMAIFETE